MTHVVYALGDFKHGEEIEVTVGHRDFPMTVWVAPAGGDTVKVQYRTHEGAPWADWDNGTVSAYSDLAFIGPIRFLKYIRVSGSSVNTKFGAV